MPLTSSVNEFFLFFLHCIQPLILPWVTVSLSLCVLLACFPPYVHFRTPSATFSSLSCSVSPLFTFVLPWSDLDKPNSSDPWYPVLPPAFPQEWTNLMINFLSLLQHTHSLTHTLNCHIVKRSAQSSCLPTNYHTTSPVLPPVPTPHLCASVHTSVYSHPLPSSITFHT